MKISKKASVVERTTVADVKAARDRALMNLGMSYGELETKARTGHLDSRRERVTWLTYRDLGEV